MKIEGRRIMVYCLRGPRGYELLVEGYHLQCPRVKDVVGQDPQLPRSPPGVLVQRRQVGEA